MTSRATLRAFLAIFLAAVIFATSNGKPSPPIELKIIDHATSSMGLTALFKTSPEEAEDSVTGYILRAVSTDPNVVSEAEIKLRPTGRLASLYGLVPDNEYRVEVVATDNDGESDALSSLARTKADVPKAPVQSLNAVDVVSTGFRVQWEEPKREGWGHRDGITGYDIELDDVTVATDHQALFYQFVDLKPSQEYDITVRPRNIIGASSDNHATRIKVETKSPNHQEL